MKYPLVPGRFKFFECSTPKCTIWLCRLVSYTYWQTHSQNDAWENDESHDRASKRVTEKATLVVARLQCVKQMCASCSSFSPIWIHRKCLTINIWAWSVIDSVTCVLSLNSSVPNYHAFSHTSEHTSDNTEHTVPVNLTIKPLVIQNCISPPKDQQQHPARNYRHHHWETQLIIFHFQYSPPSLSVLSTDKKQLIYFLSTVVLSSLLTSHTSYKRIIIIQHVA
jgi:hypothetical protein